MGACSLATLATAGCARAYQFPPINFAQAPAADAYPDVGAVALLDSAVLYYHIEEREGERVPYVVLEHHRRLKILRESGLRYATVELPIDAYGKIGRVTGRTVTPDGTERWLDPDTIKLVRRSPDSDALTAKVVSLPGPAVGAVLDLWYERLYTDLRFVPAWVLGDELPVVRAELNLISRPELLNDLRVGDGPLVTDEAPLRRELDGGLARLLWIKTDLPPLYPERHMPALQRLRPWVAVVFQGFAQAPAASAGIRRWDDVATWFRNFTRPSQRLDPELEERAQEFSAVQLYQWLQQQARPLATTTLWETAPETAAAIAAGRPAHGRDLAALLWRLLLQRNEAAAPALVVPPAGGVLVPDFPGLQPFGAVVVVLERGGGEPTVLDPGCTTCAFGELPIGLQGGRAFVIGASGTRWIDLPVSSPSANRTRLELSLRLDVKGGLEGIFSLDLLGEGARRLRAELLRRSDGWERLIQERVLDPGSALRLQELEVTNLQSPGAPLKVRGRCQVESGMARYGEASIPIDLITGGLLSEHWRSSRRYPLATGGPFVHELIVTIKAPVGWGVDAPLPVDVSSRFGSYRARYVVDGGLLSVERNLTIATPTVGATDYPDFLSFVQRARKAEGIGLVFRGGAE